MSVGENIRYYRRLKNLSAQQLAKEIGISGSYLSKIENGNVDIKSDLITKIGNILGVGVERFFCSLDENITLEKTRRAHLSDTVEHEGLQSIFIRLFDKERELYYKNFPKPSKEDILEVFREIEPIIRKLVKNKLLESYRD